MSTPITSKTGNTQAQRALAITSESAQAVPLLSDEEVDSVWDAIPQTQFWWRRYARAVEAAVRAKMGVAVPPEWVQISEWKWDNEQGHWLGKLIAAQGAKT